MAFPFYQKHVLDWIIKIPDGWERLGDDLSNDWKCKFCGHQYKIGRENECVFKYCPRCLAKIQVEYDKAL